MNENLKENYSEEGKILDKSQTKNKGGYIVREKNLRRIGNTFAYCYIDNNPLIIIGPQCNSQ